MKKIFMFAIYAFIFVLNLTFIMNVRAEFKIITYGDFTNGTWGSGSGPNCYGDSYSCWNGEGHHNGFFRLTLVDKNGKKVAGTKSVNISGNPFYNTGGFKQYNYRSISTPYGENGDYLSYKFNNNDLNDMTYISGNDVAFNYDSRYPIYSGDLSYFTKNILENVNVDCSQPENSNQCFGQNENDKYGVSFFDFFLRLSGFFDDDEVYSKSMKFNDLLSYYVIIEPGYPLWWQEKNLGGMMVYRYGTVNEWAQYIKNNPSSLVASSHKGHLFSNAGACISDENTMQKLKANGFSAEIGLANICNSGYTSVDSFISNAYGVSVSQPLHDPNKIIIDEDKLSDMLYFKMNFCDLNAGKLVFSSYDDIQNNPLILKNGNINIMGRDTDDNKKIYCYDDVEYDFSETIADLSQNNLSKNSFINPRTSKINVTRHCLLGSAAEYSATDVQNSIADFKDAKLRIKYYDNDIHEFSIKNEPIIISASKPKKVKKYTYVNFSFTLDFDIVDNTLFIGSNSGVKSGYIELSNWKKSFGLSDGVISSLTSYDLKYKDSMTSLPKDEVMQCHFDFNVSEEKSNINFRVISLDNPFPARDGSSRMPSENWLYKENNVFNYITNNRGIRSVVQSENVSPEEIYNKTKPMYTVTLTPSTMLEIRSYNKDYSYYSMYSTATDLDDGNKKMRKADAKADKLQCNENGRECISNFLRNLSDKIYKNTGVYPIEGLCFLDRTESNSYDGNSFDSVDMTQLYTTMYVTKNTKYSDSYVKYDLNKNYRADSEDYELLMNYLKNVNDEREQSNSKYYTCANKTYKSGGPVEEEK